jgi:hypothetical protein
VGAAHSVNLCGCHHAAIIVGLTRFAHRSDWHFFERGA